MFASVGVHGPVLGPTAALALDVVLLGAATLLLLIDKRLTRHQGVLLLSFVALVAVLRVVMANLPNVQPVTVAVLLAGASLGARRGVAFAILVTMLSNAVLGDGYWTLFQAAGWAWSRLSAPQPHSGRPPASRPRHPLRRPAGVAVRIRDQSVAARRGWSC